MTTSVRPDPGEDDATITRLAAVSPVRRPAPATRVGQERRLGDVLVDSQVITGDQLTAGLQQSARVGEPLGSVLLAKQWISRRQLYVALAEVWGAEMAFVDPVEVDTDLAQLFPYPMLARETWVPLRTEKAEDGELQVVVATAGRPSAHIAQEVVERTGIARVHQVVTTDWDVQRALRTVWREEVVHEAVSSLAERRPDESASTVFTWQQVAVAAVAMLAAVVGLVLDAPTTVVVLLAVVNVTIGLSVGAKALISTVGTASETVEQVTEEEVAALVDVELPRYTILVPVYREAGIVGLLMKNLSSLDYPREKLEILLLLEEDDPETLAAALAAAPPDIVRILVVPHSLPKTKPRACNVGLAFARGDLVVIYDAEDRPDPDQLKKSVVAFAKGGDDLVCVQAALNYFNAEENLLTRMFTLEYSSWFDYTLPGLDAMRLPIPLGGTSNHFRSDMLRELGGWDPFNVTEDADLGVRSSARGGRVTVVNSTTYEEANMAVGNWIRQRSRWIKGYMQTFLVHTRHPLRLVRQIGLRQAIGFLLTIGGTPATFLLTPILWTLFALYLALPQWFTPHLPPWLMVVSLANLLIGNGMIVYLSLLAGFKRRTYGLVGYALLSPFYWMLHSVASYKAAWQLVTKPFYWEKTQHGLTSHTQDDDESSADDAAGGGAGDDGTTRPAPRPEAAPVAAGPLRERVPASLAVPALAAAAAAAPALQGGTDAAHGAPLASPAEARAEAAPGGTAPDDVPEPEDPEPVTTTPERAVEPLPERATDPRVRADLPVFPGPDAVRTPTPQPDPDPLVPVEDTVPPLDLDDLAQLRAELEVLDERDLLEELAPRDHRGAPRAPVSVEPALLRLAPLVPPTGRAVCPPVPAGSAPGTGPAQPDADTPVPLHTRPPVPPTRAPAAEPEPVRRSGPLPRVSPTAPAVPAADPDTDPGGAPEGDPEKPVQPLSAPPVPVPPCTLPTPGSPPVPTAPTAQLSPDVAVPPRLGGPVVTTRRVLGRPPVPGPTVVREPRPEPVPAAPPRRSAGPASGLLSWLDRP